MLANAQADHLFHSISGSKGMHWILQSVKCKGKYVEQDEGRKSKDQELEAEFQERFQKE